MARRPLTCTGDRVHRRLGDRPHRCWGLGGAHQPTLGRYHRGGLRRDRVLYAVVRAAWCRALGNHSSRAHRRRLRHRVMALQSHKRSPCYGHRLRQEPEQRIPGIWTQGKIARTLRKSAPPTTKIDDPPHLGPIDMSLQQILPEPNCLGRDATSLVVGSRDTRSCRCR